MSMIPRRTGEGRRINETQTTVRRDVQGEGQSGRNLQLMGQALGEVENKFRQLKDQHDFTTAHREFSQQVNAIDDDVQTRISKGEDPFKIGEELDGRINKTFQAASGRIRNPNMRVQFDTMAQSKADASRAVLKKFVREKQIEVASLNLDETLATFSDDYFKAQDAVSRRIIESTAEDLIRSKTGTLFNAKNAAQKIENFKKNLRAGQVHHDIDQNFTQEGLSAVRDELLKGTEGRYSELPADERRTQVNRVKGLIDALAAKDKEQDLRVREQTITEAGDLLSRRELSSEWIRSAVLSGTMDAEMAVDLQLAIASPDEWGQRVDGEPGLEAKIFIESLNDLSKASPEERLKVVQQALRNHADKKLNRDDLTFIFRTAAGLSIDNEHWGLLGQAMDLLPPTRDLKSLFPNERSFVSGLEQTGSISSMAMKTFTRVWDMKSDPRPAMKRSLENAHRESDPRLAKFEIGTVTPFGVVVGIDPETGKVLIDESKKS